MKNEKDTECRWFFYFILFRLPEITIIIIWNVAGGNLIKFPASVLDLR